MEKKRIIKLHWRLFFPLVGLIWLIIGITIAYSVEHERSRQRENLEHRLLNVNETVIAAYNRGVDLQNTVNFIKLFTDKTTLDPLRLTVYDNNGNMLADNAEPTILLQNKKGNPIPELLELEAGHNITAVRNMMMDSTKCMICAMGSADGKVHSFAALPYKGVVLAFLSVDPMVWSVVMILGLLSSVIAYFGLRAVCRDVYNLRDFANAISSDKPMDISEMDFSQDELGDVSRNLMLLYHDKIEAEREKAQHERRISMDINHELKTPVGIVKGYLDTIISDRDMPEELRMQFLESAKQNVDRLSNLIKYLSDITRLEADGESIETSEVDFHKVAEALAKDVAMGRISGNLQFVADVPEGCRVVAHEPLVVNALLNLTDNAAKYSGGTAISLRWLREENGMQYFSFSDNGTGVKEESLPHLFDLFYRVDKGRSRKNGGTGLGLAIVRKTFVSLGGDITVKNADGGGLEYTFSLPAASQA